MGPIQKMSDVLLISWMSALKPSDREAQGRPVSIFESFPKFINGWTSGSDPARMRIDVRGWFHPRHFESMLFPAAHTVAGSINSSICAAATGSTVPGPKTAAAPASKRAA